MFLPFRMQHPDVSIRPPNDADPRHDGLTVWQLERRTETMAPFVKMR